MLPPFGTAPSQPTPTTCRDCGTTLGAVYGWCGGCRAAYCFPCGRAHYCTPTCAANGCFPGLCVREVRDGVLSERWGLPPDG